jgi:flagellar motility protein MotE (MotC chaperone)
MPTPTLSRGWTARPCGGLGLVLALAASVVCGWPASAQDERTTESQKVRSNADRAAENDAGRFCGNVAPSAAEARIAWQTRRLAELDAQVKQRLADLEKAEASIQEWVAKRDALVKAASDDLVAIYTRMQPERAAAQLSAMDDQMAAAIIGKLKPTAAGAILDEMEVERASKLESFLSGANGAEKKS